MRIFVTGASGFIGGHLVRSLTEEDHRVTVLMRNISESNDLIKKGIKIIHGDIFDIEKLKYGMEGCDWVFHLAAYARPASFDPDLPYRTNVQGTLNVLEASKEKNVRRVVITSTAGTMSFSSNGLPVDENTPNSHEYHTEYEKTKALCEKNVFEYESPGMDVIVVNPSRVFGPGKISISNSVTRIIRLYGMGLWRIMPGDGNAIGNYSFIDDIVRGHILAARNGKNRERYILGGENISFRTFFDVLDRIYGTKRKLIKLDARALKQIAKITGVLAGFTGRPLPISDKWIDKYLQNWVLSSEKAIRDLSYSITPFDVGVERTVSWLNSVNKEV